MRCVLTGVDGDGRSCVAEVLEAPDPSGDVDVLSLLRLRTGALEPRPDGTGELLDLGVRPGRLQWVVSRWAPGATAAGAGPSGLHHTDTIDLDLVLAGSIELVLADGPHLLEAGDAAVVRGVDHGWRAGPDGCTLSVVLLGTPER
jgi:hypothetical protein